MEILRGYGLGLIMAQLLNNYCNRHRIVPKAGKCLGTLFGTGIGVTQCDPASPINFNIVVDEVVRALLYVVCIPQEDNHDMGWAAWERNLVVYADDGRIAGRVMNGSRMH